MTNNIPCAHTHHHAGKAQIPALTSIKGLFILLIVLHNTVSTISAFDSIPGIFFIRSHGGIMGDAMFYMLSGFLMTYSYRERIQNKIISFPNYLLRRLQKLYPLYFITNVIAMAVSFVNYGINSIPIKTTIFTFLLQMGGGLEAGVPYNSPTWFICALFVCYIVYYFIVFSAKHDTHYYCSIILGITVGYALTTLNLSIPLCYPGNGSALTNFFIGVILAELFPHIKSKTHLWLQPACVLGLLVSFFLMFRYGIDIISGSFPTACTFMICPAILYLAISDNWISRILTLKPFIWIGKLSMSVFFWHSVVFSLMVLLFTDGFISPQLYAVYLIVLLICSMASYRWIEKACTNK